MFENEDVKMRIQSLGSKQEWITNYLLGEGLETKGKTSKGVKNKTKLSLI